MTGSKAGRALRSVLDAFGTKDKGYFVQKRPLRGLYKQTGFGAVHVATIVWGATPAEGVVRTSPISRAISRRADGTSF